MSLGRGRDAVDPWDAGSDPYDDDEVKAEVANGDYWDAVGPFDPTDGRPSGEDIRADYMNAVEWPGSSGEEADTLDLED